MADFVAVLKKTLDGLSDTSPPMREKVYDRARATIASKLTAMNPPLAPAVVERQKRALEDAITQIEKDFGKAARANSDPIGELEGVFASLRNPAPIAQRPAYERASVPALPAPASTARSYSPPGPLLPAPARAGAPAQIAPPAKALPPADDATSREDEDDFEDDDTRYPSEPAQSETIAIDARRNRGNGRVLLVAAVVLALLAGGGYGLWVKRAQVETLLAQYGIVLPNISGDTDQPATASQEPSDAEPETDVVAAPPAAAPEAPTEVAPPATEMAAAETQKFTQKLNADGTEVDEGPATAAPILGEGTTVAAATLPPVAPPQTVAEADAAPVDAAPATPPADTAQTSPVGTPAPAEGTPPASTDSAANPPAAPVVAATEPTVTPAPTAAQSESIPVGQRAIFYEERTNVSEASAEAGSIVWSLVQESPGNNMPPEPVIRAEATIPGKDVQLRMTIRRNTDQTLPASHIVEMIFLTPEGFEGGGIETVLRLSLKGSEQEAGSPLLGIPAKIADGFFLIALNDTKQEIDSNLALLRNQSWIDVPVQYKNGRRALFTMEKGIPGAKVFDEALKAWQVATASAG